MEDKTNILNLVFIILGGLALLFIVAPLLGMFLNTSPTELLETAKNSEVRSSIWLTLSVSFSATIIFAIAAIPLSYLLARNNFRGKRIIMAIIDIPVIIPHSAAGIAILGLISRNSVIGKIGEELGISFVGNPAGIAIAMAFVSIPFLLNAAHDGFAAVPVRLEKAALNLGASPIQVFFKISFPLASRSIVSGLILMFGRGMSEFGAVIIIAYHPMVTPVLIYERFNEFGLAYARPVAVIFIIVCLLFFVLLRMLTNKTEKQLV